MILNAIVPPSGANVNPESPNAPRIQIGLETGQGSWQLHMNYPESVSFAKTRRQFKGELQSISHDSLKEIELIAGFGRQQGWDTAVVYEAGGFGQKLGRDIVTSGASPVQLVARNVEYVCFKNQKDVPKTDRIDAQRLAHIPLDHPELPYADIQDIKQEDLRLLFAETKRLDKDIHRINAQLCASLRGLHVGTHHRTVDSWLKLFQEDWFLELKDRSFAKAHCLDNLVTQLHHATHKRDETHKLLQQQIDEISATWKPPIPDAQPAKDGCHPLKALGENSPLREKSLPDALKQIKGIGPVTILTLIALVGDPRRFKSKKAFRAFLGLATTPHNSCTIRKSLGMKRGNPILRKLMIQLAWRWCAMHPESHLALKYFPKLDTSRRSKKIAICALAGELAEMLYTYLVHGKDFPGLNVRD